MSTANLEVARQVIEANRSEDLEGALATALALSDPRIEFTPILAAVEPRTYHGHDGLRRYFAELADHFDAWHMEVDEVVSAGSDVVVVVFRTYVSGRHMGVEIETRRAVLFTFSDGKLLRGRVYPSRDEAVEAAG